MVMVEKADYSANRVNRSGVQSDLAPVISADLMFTVLRPVTTRKAMTGDIYRRRMKEYVQADRDLVNEIEDNRHTSIEELLLKLFPDERIWELIIKTRESNEHLLMDPDFWVITNKRIYTKMHQVLTHELIEPAVENLVDFCGVPEGFREVAFQSGVEAIQIKEQNLWVVAHETNTEFLTDGRHYEPNHGLLKVLGKQRTNGTHVVIGSNQHHMTALNLLDDQSIRGRFNRVFTSGSLGVSKPSKEFWHRMRQKLDSKGRMVHVGNSVNNDWGCVEEGMTAILYDIDGIGREQLNRQPRSPRLECLANLICVGIVRLVTSDEELEEVLGEILNN